MAIVVFISPTFAKEFGSGTIRLIVVSARSTRSLHAHLSSAMTSLQFTCTSGAASVVPNQASARITAHAATNPTITGPDEGRTRMPLPPRGEVEPLLNSVGLRTLGEPCPVLHPHVAERLSGGREMCCRIGVLLARRPQHPQHELAAGREWLHSQILREAIALPDEESSALGISSPPLDFSQQPQRIRLAASFLVLVEKGQSA